MKKINIKLIELKPRINKANNQINFQLKKSSLSKELLSKLPNLKSIKINEDNFNFEKCFEEKWK